jgi:NAD(P)-dependent dehydrogenase (short-subunit alcohol dehydrogenase family)
MQKSSPKRRIFPPQHQPHPGMEYKMKPLPEFDAKQAGSNKLVNKMAVVTGGDSGIGRAVAVAFAKEGANVAILYLNEHTDAKATGKVITEKYNRNCLLIPCDIGKEKECFAAIRKVIRKFKRIDILVNNAAVHYPAESILKINSRQLMKTFAVNIFSMFWITQAALPHMKEGSSIINTTSVTAYRGSSHLIDYSATKGAIVSFTRSLSASLIDRKIRVNGVAPGPVWTPLVPASFPAKKVKTYGTDSPMKRPGQPGEIAPAYVFLASQDAQYITGQFIHPNGGEIVNG